MNFFATAFVEPTCKEVALLLSLSLQSSSYQTLIKTDSSNFSYDASKKESYYLATKSSFGGSIFFRHLSNCSGLRCACLSTICAPAVSKIDVFEEFKRISGEYEIISTSSDGLLYHNSTQPHKCLKQEHGSYYFYNR